MLNPDIECTAIDVPLDWDDPRGAQVQVVALRIRTDAARRRGTVWLLDGGPGGSGVGFLGDPGLVGGYTSAGWDVIVPPHRGTVSPRLRCTSASPQLCREELEDTWGDTLAEFNTLNAAQDLGALIERAQVDDTGSTVVYGVSYGSFWAHYYLGVHPTQADAVILDSVLRAGVDVVQQLILDHERAEDLLDRCVDDPACGETLPHLSGSAFAAALVDRWDTQDCGDADNGLWHQSSFPFRFADLVNSPVTRNYLPLLVALLAECDPQKTAIASAAIGPIFSGSQVSSPSGPNRRVGWGPTTEAPPFGLPPDLFYVDEVFSIVAATSIIADGVDAQGVLDGSTQNLVALGIGNALATTQNVYGDLPNDGFDANFAAQTPTLILNARYDLQTPLAWAEQAGELLGVDVQVFDDGAHGVAFRGTGGKLPDGSPCATQMILDFAAEPDGDLDTTCLGELQTIDVSLQREDLRAISLQAFGTDDPWSLVE